MKRSILSLFLLPFLLLSCGALWQSDTRSPVELARAGEYKDAAASLEPMVAGGNFDPVVVQSLYYSWVRTGDYAKAREKFEAWSGANPNAGPVRLAAGRINYVTGNYERALAHLNAILNFPNVGVAAQYEKAQVLQATGKREEADAVHEKIVDNYLNGITRSPADALWVARSMWALEKFHDANDVLKIVTQADPRNAEAFVAWGDLLAEKYNEPEAIASYQDALKIDPNLPEAHLGMAKTLALTEPERAAAEIEKALDDESEFHRRRICSRPTEHRFRAVRQGAGRDRQGARGQSRSPAKRSACWRRSAFSATRQTSSTSTFSRCLATNPVLQQDLRHPRGQLRFTASYIRKPSVLPVKPFASIRRTGRP